MKIPIIRIGNSKGIRLSKTILEKYQIKDDVELILQEECILIKPVKRSRKGWGEKFRMMRQEKDDTLLIDDVFEDENLEEWK